MNNLLDILKGCLFSSTINQAQLLLKKYFQSPTFLQQLLILIPNQQAQILIMILTTLKNYMHQHWSPLMNSGRVTIPFQQKQLIKQNILNLYYQIKDNQSAVNVYRQILYFVICAQYPWNGINQQLNDDFNNNIFAAAEFSRQVTKVYEYSTESIERDKRQYFVNNFFPRLQNLVEQSISNFNDQTSKLILLLFKTFYSAFHLQLPNYLKNQQNLSKWFMYIKTILNTQLQNNILNQRISARILSRLVYQYLNQQLDSKYQKGWSQNLRNKHANQITQTIFNSLSSPNGDQQTLSYILHSIIAYCKNDKLRGYLNEQNVTFIIYDRLLPNMETSSKDLELFFKDPLEYITKNQDLNANAFIHNAADTIQHILNYCIFGQKSQMMKFIQYSANALQSNTISDRHKQILIRQLTKMSQQLKKNKFIKTQFQNLTITYFIPLLKIDSSLLNSQICRLFAAYLDDMKLSTATVGQLMGLIYQKMIGKSPVLKYNAILAFTSLLKHDSALESAKIHFQSILQIYVKMLDQYQNQNLLKCLQSIVNSFSSQIVTFAPNLITHLLSKFYQNYNNQQQNQDDENDDGNKQSVAALSTIQQILQCPLSDQIYYNTSQQIIPMLKQLFDELQQYFGQIINLINILIYKGKIIADAEFVYVLCRRLLEGKMCGININQLNYEYQNVLNKITSQSDPQYQQNLISILKNLIQKLPDNILHKYPYPLHSQLILSMIQNKRLTYDQILNLNTSLVDSIWSQYLQSYTYLITGQGSITNPSTLKYFAGISLYPWLMGYFDVSLCKIILSQIQSEEDQNDDDYYQENTMQMLEKYANDEDEEEQCDQYYATQGVNYSFLYDSPFDCSKDKEIFVQKLKSLSNQDANQLMNLLNNKDKKRLQTLFN